MSAGVSTAKHPSSSNVAQVVSTTAWLYDFDWNWLPFLSCLWFISHALECPHPNWCRCFRINECFVE